MKGSTAAVRTVMLGVLALSVLGPASADDGSQGVVGFTDAAGIVGFAARAGDAAAGAIVVDGEVAPLACLDMVEGREETHTVYARYAGARGEFWLHIASHVQGSTQAVAGVGRGTTSGEHCGAAAVPTTTPFVMTCSTHELLRDLP